MVWYGWLALAVILGDQGKAGQAQVALALKVAQEHLAQFIQPVVGMCHLFLPPIIF